MVQSTYKLLLLTALGLSQSTAAKHQLRELTRTSPTQPSEATLRKHDNTAPEELNVDARSTFNEGFMALMQSPCRPERDGYFGATSGAPAQVQYGFQLETLPLSNIMDLLDVIEDKLVDDILSNSFPSLCGYRRRKLQRELTAHHASGYRFLKFEEVEKCTPEVSPINYCGVFVGKINVFGKNQEDAVLQIIDMIHSILNPRTATKLHPELVKVFSVEKYVAVAGDDLNFNISSKSDAHVLGWVGLGFALLILILAIYWYFIRDRKLGDTAFNNNTKRNKRTFNKAFKRHQRYMDYDRQDYGHSNSTEPVYESEAVSFNGGETLLLTDGRPVGIDFDHSYADMTLDPRAEQGII